MTHARSVGKRYLAGYFRWQKGNAEISNKDGK